MKKNLFEFVGVILVNFGIFLLSISVVPVVAYCTYYSDFFNRLYWIALLYLAIPIVCILAGKRMIGIMSKEQAFTAIGGVVCLATNYLLVIMLLLNVGVLLTATNYSLIPYLVLVAVILTRPWNKLTPTDQLLVGWSWIPLILFLMPVIHRYFDGKDVW